MRLVKGLVIGTVGLFLAACGAQGGNKAPEAAGSGAVKSGMEAVPEVKLPEVPDSLTRPEERAAFLVVRYWDSLDFGNDPLALDTAFLEQNFSNFISVLPYAPQPDAAEAMARLVSRSQKSHAAADLVKWVAEKYLDDPNSPMRSEELYILFLKGVLESGKTGEADRTRAEFRLAQAMKNRPGTTGADFRMVSREGRSSSLRKELEADTTLVMFYDPDCSQCKEITGKLASSKGALPYRVMAVDVAADRELWESTKHQLPKEWSVWFATDPVDDEELYVLPALPSFYLLAPDGTVLLKDIAPSQIIGL